MADAPYNLASAEIVARPPAGAVFGAILFGLIVGLFAGVALLLVFGAVASIPSGRVLEGFALASAFAMWVIIVGPLFAIFPIGPLWVLLAQILIRRRARSLWSYAAAGAAAATCAPILVPFLLYEIFTHLHELFTQPFAFLRPGPYVFVAWFAISGAVGGGFSGVLIGKLFRESEANIGRRERTATSATERVAS